MNCRLVHRFAHVALLYVFPGFVFDPIAEDLPTFLPQPVHRFRHVLTIAVVVVTGVAVYIVVRDLNRGYWTTRGARVAHYTLRSRLVHTDLHEIKVVPAHHGNWTLVLLHGRGGGPSSMLSQSLFDALHDLGPRAPVVLLLDGGDHS